MKVYVVMKSVWLDLGYPRIETSLVDVYYSKRSAMRSVDRLVNEQYDKSINNYYEIPTIKTSSEPHKGIYEVEVRSADGHVSVTFFIQEETLKGYRKENSDD